MGVTDPPFLSVLFPVYNGERTLRAAIESVLSQTFQDFELLILDDGSSDGSARILETYAADRRVRLFHHANRGLAETLNRGLGEARGAWIARQDQDDLSLPERFARQVAAVRADPSLVLLGAHATVWTEKGGTGRVLRHPIGDRALRLFLYFDNPFVHSSVLMRKDAVLRVGGYRTERQHQPEDYDLWSRLAEQGRIGNLPEILVRYFEWAQSMSRASMDPFPFLPAVTAGHAQRRLGLPLEPALAWGQLAHRKPASFGAVAALALGLRIVFRERAVNLHFLRRWMGLVRRAGHIS